MQNKPQASFSNSRTRRPLTRWRWRPHEARWPRSRKAWRRPRRRFDKVRWRFRGRRRHCANCRLHSGPQRKSTPRRAKKRWPPVAAQSSTLASWRAPAANLTAPLRPSSRCSAALQPRAANTQTSRRRWSVTAPAWPTRSGLCRSWKRRCANRNRRSSALACRCATRSSR